MALKYFVIVWMILQSVMCREFSVCWDGDSDCPKCKSSPTETKYNKNIMIRINPFENLKFAEHMVEAEYKILELDEKNIIRLEDPLAYHTTFMYICCITSEDIKKIESILKNLKWSSMMLNYSSTTCNIDHNNYTIYITADPNDESQNLLWNLEKTLEKEFIAQGIPVVQPRTQRFHSTFGRVTHQFPTDKLVNELNEGKFSYGSVKNSMSDNPKPEDNNKPSQHDTKTFPGPKKRKKIVVESVEQIKEQYDILAHKFKKVRRELKKVKKQKETYKYDSLKLQGDGEELAKQLKFAMEESGKYFAEKQILEKLRNRDEGEFKEKCNTLNVQLTERQNEIERLTDKVLELEIAASNHSSDKETLKNEIKELKNNESIETEKQRLEIKKEVKVIQLEMEKLKLEKRVKIEILEEEIKRREQENVKARKETIKMKEEVGGKNKIISILKEQISKRDKDSDEIIKKLKEFSDMNLKLLEEQKIHLEKRSELEKRDVKLENEILSLQQSNKGISKVLDNHDKIKKKVIKEKNKTIMMLMAIMVVFVLVVAVWAIFVKYGL